MCQGEQMPDTEISKISFSADGSAEQIEFSVQLRYIDYYFRASPNGLSKKLYF